MNPRALAAVAATLSAVVLAPAALAMESSSSFDTGTLTTNASGSWTAGTPGTYAYICTIHPSMQGTLNVTRDSGSGQSFAVEISSFAFRPDALEVPSGAQLVWTNRDGAPHTATSTRFTPAPEDPDGMADDGAGNGTMHNDTMAGNDTMMDDRSMMDNGSMPKDDAMAKDDGMMKNDTMAKDDTMMGNGTKDEGMMGGEQRSTGDAMPAKPPPSPSPAATPGPAFALALAAAGLAAALARRR